MKNTFFKTSRGKFLPGLKLAAAVAVALLIALSSASAQSNNILLLIADDLGWDNLASFNTNSAASIPYTPNIDKLAQSGIVFTHFYARPSCSQSRATIITGRDSFRTGVGCAIAGATTPVLSSNEYTLPRAFATNAPQYSLASFGKWHLGGTSTAIYDTDSPYLTGGWTNFQGFYSPQVASYFNWTKWSNGISFNTTNYTTLDQVHDATNFIETQGTNRWFLWLAFNAPHSPYHLPPTNLLTSPKYLALSGTTQDVNTNTRPYYEAMIQSLDTEIGVLLSVIPTNTDIIFIGDNGTPIQVIQPPFYNTSVPETVTGNGHAKFTIFEGGARTPLIVTGPDVGSPGRYNDTLVNEPDLFSTIQELAGINVAATLPTNVVIDSVSLLPAIKADVIRPTPYVIEEQFNEGPGANQGTTSDGVTLRNGQFKLLHFYYHTNDVSWERFYDLSSDPYEFTNLLGSTLTPTQQANYYALRRQLGLSASFENILYRRSQVPAPSIASFQFTNGSFTVNEQYTQISTNVNTAAFPQLASAKTYPAQPNIDYSVTLWRSYDVSDPLGWTPVANTILTPGTNSSLVISNTVLTDLNATNAQAFYSVTPYIP
ncbi:MAG TPA: sulfatase-like hydrolase/transferase [Pseudomonadales bacterium]|nr:sulfatase-like hydrolase/transferase [Pseudomonadales bacterium]